MTSALDPQLKARLRRLRQDFPYFASQVLRIKTKKPGPLVPLNLNTAQVIVHNKLEEQKRLTGMVRAIILKYRQPGISTEIEGRYYHQTSLNRGIKAFILTHEQLATDNLFAMVERFYENSPAELRPHLGASNAKELKFDWLDSEYAVATAGTKGAGRSQTAQLFHGSEVAYWANAKDHMAGIGQIISKEPGTEMVLESTGNGMGNWFHNAWQLAERGDSEYQPIFLPWKLTPEYATDVPEGFKFDLEDREYGELHRLTREQLYWRRRKIIDDFHGDGLLFQQEYPATAVEAFIAMEDSYIKAISVLRARKTLVENPYGALLLGVDPSRFGNDRTVVAWRRGRKVHQVECLRTQDTMELTGTIATFINKDKPAKVFIDKVGLGVGIYDRLIELGYGNIVIGVDAGAKPSNEEDHKRYFNLRAQMVGKVKEWLEDAPAQIPDVDEIQADLLAPKYTYDSNQRLKIESKEDMRKRGVRSTDILDAIGLTFAYPISALAEAIGVKQQAPRRIQRREVSWQAR